MEFKKKTVAVIGAGPAGCMCAYFVSKNADVTLFDFSKPLRTLLYTGGGRCNLAYAEYDFKELVKFYPRGEKFLYSVFSRFSTSDTIDFFKKIGVETYVQDDLRIFPVSNSAKDVREKFLANLRNCKFKKEKVFQILPPTPNPPPQGGRGQAFTPTPITSRERCSIVPSAELPTLRSSSETGSCASANSAIPFVKGGGSKNFQIKTQNNTYIFDKVVIATGGHYGFSLAENLGHKIIEPKPALTSLVTAENFKSLQGVSLKNIEARIFYFDKKFAQVKDDILFTADGISGPLAYKISSICARLDYSKQNPLTIRLSLFCHAEFNSASIPLVNNGKILKRVQDDVNRKTFYFQNMLNYNPKKNIKNLLSEFIPKSLAEYILKTNKIDLDKKCCDIDAKTRDLILNLLLGFEINIISPAKDGEIVTAGGVCLDEINAKTMQSKLVDGLYFCGEVINVDGFCGGFNLQNCWSTGFVAGNNL